MPQPSVLCRCPYCRFEAKVAVQDLGETARCPRCKASFVLNTGEPGEGGSAPDAALGPPLKLAPPPLPKEEETLYEPPSEELLDQPLAPSSLAQTPSSLGKNLWIGAVIALGTFALPFARFVFSQLGTLIHELGHTVASWAFGYPAIPSFDFVYGGGLTQRFARSGLALFLIACGLLFLIWYLRRRHKATLWLSVSFVMAYGIVAATRLHDLLITAMGHGMVLVFAGIFLYRSVREETQKIPIEGPLYAACGIFLLLTEASLAWGLMRDADSRELYAMAKGGLLEGDLTILGRAFGGSVVSAARILFAGSLLTPLLTYLVCRYDISVIEGLKREGLGE